MKYCPDCGNVNIIVTRDLLSGWPRIACRNCKLVVDVKVLRKDYPAPAPGGNPCGEVPLDFEGLERRMVGDDPNVQELSKPLGHDAHKARAAKLFGIPEDQVNEAHRRVAKKYLFSQVYGYRKVGKTQLMKELAGELMKEVGTEPRCPHTLGDQNCKYPNLHQCSPDVECDKTRETCRAKFDNEKNFGGWPIFAEGGVVDGPKLFSDLYVNPHVVPRESILERMTRLRDESQKAHDKVEAALGDVLKDRAARPVTVGEHVERALKKIRGSGEPITTVKPTHSPIEMIGELSSGIHPIFREYERRRGFTTHIDRVEYDGKTVGIFNEIPEVGEVHWWAHPHGIEPGAAAIDRGTVSTVDDAVEEIKRVFNDTPQILRLKVTTKYQTTEACPVQWFGMLSNSQAFYARYRFGHLTVRVGRGHASEEELAAGELVFDERVGDTFDGEMSWERICELTPLEDR